VHEFSATHLMEERRHAALCRSVDLLREIAATAELVALTYEHVASSEDCALPTRSVPTGGRAARAASLSVAERHQAHRMWHQADSLEHSN
jgi:hypothetical protein